MVSGSADYAAAEHSFAAVAVIQHDRLPRGDAQLALVPTKHSSGRIEIGGDWGAVSRGLGHHRAGGWQAGPLEIDQTDRLAEQVRSTTNGDCGLGNIHRYGESR